MAILSFEEAPGQSAHVSQSEGDGQRQFLARTDNPRTPFTDIVRHPNCPRVGDPHPHSPALFAIDIAPTQQRNKYWWDVVVEYSSAPEIEKHDNPLKRPAEVSIAWQPQEVLTTVDAEGEPMRNLAGELLAPQGDDGMQLVIRVVKNLPPSIPSWVLSYRGAVNADPLRLKGLTFPKETLRVRGLDLRFPPQLENRIRFVPLSLELHYEPAGWFWRPLNRGFHESVVRDKRLDDGRVVKVRRLERIKLPPTNEYPAEELFLDQNGRVYRTKEGEIRTQDLSPREIITLKFPKGKRLPFSALNSVLK